jgi:hypothetical protein
MVAGAQALAAVRSPATAASSSRNDDMSNSAVQVSAAEDISARTRRRFVRRYRVVRVYPAPTYYGSGYFGPTHYERPYRQPVPFFFGLGGRW